MVIGARSGSFQRMPDERTFPACWIRDGAKVSSDFGAMPDAPLEYERAEPRVKDE
jgi:hypothetical protein